MSPVYFSRPLAAFAVALFLTAHLPICPHAHLRNLWVLTLLMMTLRTAPRALSVLDGVLPEPGAGQQDLPQSP